MSIDRRGFITGAGLTAATMAAACHGGRPERLAANLSALGSPPDWEAVRAEFPLSPRHIHLALMLLTSHPRPVREAIERHRRALDENPTEYFQSHSVRLEAEVRAAVARYTGGAADDVALTDSTTMSLAVLYGGLSLRPGQVIVTSTHDHYATHENLRLAAARSGLSTSIHKVALYDDPAAATEEEVARRLEAAITPTTRDTVLAAIRNIAGAA